jgi:hypothetical protein
MPLAHSLSSLSGAMTQVSTESEQNHSVSRLNCLPLVFADNRQIRDPGSSFFANAQNVLITGGAFVVVSLSYGLYKLLKIVHILSARTIFNLPILEKAI